MERHRAVAFILLMVGVIGSALMFSHRGVDQKDEAPQLSGAHEKEREDTTRFWVHYRAAMAARRSANWPSTVQELTLALELDPEHEDGHYYLANALFETAEYAAAERHWQQIIEQNPLSSRAHVQLASLYSCPDITQFYDLETARAHLERAVELNPEETGPAIRLGEVELALGNLERAEQLLEHARRTNPRAASAHYLCAYLAWRSGDSERAQSVLQLAHDAVAVARETDVPMLEGDVRVGDGARNAGESMSRRRLFAPVLAELARQEVVSPAEEASRLDLYLASLPHAR